MTHHAIYLYFCHYACLEPTYCVQLSPQDQQRLQYYPQLAQQVGWQVSRYLISWVTQYYTPNDSYHICLSHRHRMAAIAIYPSFMQVGIDLEAVQQRSFAIWREWVLTPAEQEWLAIHGASPQNHYLLWTLKESLLKASQQTLAEIQQVGLQKQPQYWQLATQDNSLIWQSKSFTIASDMMISCVYAHPTPLPVYCQGIGLQAAAQAIHLSLTA